MLWAAIATFLWSKPTWVQAVFVGVCSGLFVAALMGNWLDGELDPVGLFVFVGFSMVSGGRSTLPGPSFRVPRTRLRSRRAQSQFGSLFYSRSCGSWAWCRSYVLSLSKDSQRLSCSYCRSCC